MNDRKQDSGTTDPFAAWQKFLNDAERQLNENFNEMMATPQFGESSRLFMQAMTKYRETMHEAGRKYFTAMNMPTRDDLVTLGERLSVIEDRLNNIENLLRQGAEAADKPAQPKPRRTKKPPSKSGGKS